MVRGYKYYYRKHSAGCDLESNLKARIPVEYPLLLTFTDFTLFRVTTLHIVKKKKSHALACARTHTRTRVCMCFFHVENEQFFDKCDIQSIVPSQDLTGHQRI